MSNIYARQRDNYEKIKKYRDEDGYTIMKTCAKVGICAHTYYRLLALFENEDSRDSNENDDSNYSDENESYKKPTRKYRSERTTDSLYTKKSSSIFPTTKRQMDNFGIELIKSDGTSLEKPKKSKYNKHKSIKPEKSKYDKDESIQPKKGENLHDFALQFAKDAFN